MRAKDPELHRICLAIARRCMVAVDGLLDREERKEALRDFYRATLAVLEKGRQS